VNKNKRKVPEVALSDLLSFRQPNGKRKLPIVVRKVNVVAPKKDLIGALAAYADSDSD
jgi:hypothetical protein